MNITSKQDCFSGRYAACVLASGFLHDESTQEDPLI